MKIRVLVNCAGVAGSLVKDREYTVSPEVGKDLCNAGYAKAIAKPAVKKRETREQK